MFLSNFFSLDVWKIILQIYLIFTVISLVIGIGFKIKKGLIPFLVYLVIIAISVLSYYLDLDASLFVFVYLALVYPVILFIFYVPDIRKAFESKNKNHKITLVSSSIKTKNEIADASMYLSKKKIGALITIEKNNSLDQYSSKAIILDSEVSKELLINIFTPYTPLHDGAVIIRGNRIRCAGAYFKLTDNQEELDKTTGSRHRAALGISEMSDSLTICVSEETGDISLATEGMMIEANDKSKILEYLDLFLQ